MATAPVLLDTSVTEEKILAAVQRIVEAANPLRIIAFGSRARGDFRPDSDLDLAVFFERLDPNGKRPVTSDVFHGTSMPVDLLVFDPGRHEKMRYSLCSVNNEIDRHGVVLYNREHGRADLVAIARLVGW